jgi:hypothetical protein
MNAVRQTISLLVSAGGEENIAKVIGMVLQNGLGPAYEVTVKEIPRASTFLKAAETEQVDIFIIVLNNMVPDASELFPGTCKPDQALQIIAYLKQKYHKPIIAMAGWWPQGMNIHEEAKRAGADYFFVLPPHGDQLFPAFLRCLGLSASAHEASTS